MNINPKAFRILCFGDSNTWGDPPLKLGRYPVDVRWPGRLQKLLGDNYEVIEEGLCGRTTNLDDPKEFGRNGKTYLIPCLKTHNPLDMVILMLGSNDLKERYNRSPKEIADAIDELVKIIKINSKAKIILMSPPHVKENFVAKLSGLKGAEEKSKDLGKLFMDVTNSHKIKFLDVAKIVEPSKKDGVHLEPDAHKKIAEELAKIVIQ
jgi:lysophospholipase L1-like esterase